MNLVEIHIIQSVPPANLNRDDTGSPKDTVFGGIRRARISSQAQKRAVRTFFDGWKKLSPQDRAVRTRLLPERLLQELAKRNPGLPEKDAQAVVTAALAGLQLVEADSNGSTQYLIFLGDREIQRVAELIVKHWDQLCESGKKLRGIKKKAERAKLVPEDVKNELQKCLDGGKAVDIALFGRMLADQPELAKDASCQVAHAISTHRVDREFDFYTAVDDLRPREQPGAAMMGDVEFYTATFYRYANINLDLLRNNLQEDLGLVKHAVEGFLRGFVLTLPSGKQNSFAAHSLPQFVALLVRGDCMPRNLAAAFEKGVYPADGKGLTEASVDALLKYWQRLDEVYGKPEEEWAAIVCLPEVDFPYRRENRVGSLEEAVKGAMEGVTALLGGA